MNNQANGLNLDKTSFDVLKLPQNKFINFNLLIKFRTQVNKPRKNSYYSQSFAKKNSSDNDCHKYNHKAEKKMNTKTKHRKFLSVFHSFPSSGSLSKAAMKKERTDSYNTIKMNILPHYIFKKQNPLYSIGMKHNKAMKKK